MITSEQSFSGQTRRVTVTRGALGWQLVEEVDSRVVRTQTYTDWHRVERAMQGFERRAADHGTSTKR